MLYINNLTCYFFHSYVYFVPYSQSLHCSVGKSKKVTFRLPLNLLSVAFWTFDYLPAAKIYIYIIICFNSLLKNDKIPFSRKHTSLLLELNGNVCLKYFCHLKGLFTDFTWGAHRTVSSSEMRFTFSVFHYFHPCGRYGRIYKCNGGGSK